MADPGTVIEDTCTQLQVRISVNDSENPEIVIPFINKEVLKDCFYYKEQIDIAKKLIAVLTYIKNGAVFEQKAMNRMSKGL